jgi:hypothetical protein
MLKVVGSVVSQVAVLTALLYYFGWARAQAAFDYFGLDPATVGYTTADYVLRSVSATFEPIFVGLLLALLLPTLHRSLVVPTLRRKTLWRRIGPRVIIIARVIAFSSYGLICISLIFQLSIGHSLGIALPVLLAAVSLALNYVDYLRQAGHLNLTAPPRDNASRGLMTIRTTSLYSLSFVGIFWAFGLYAANVGIQTAVDFSRSLPYQSEVILYSTQRLGISGPGISVDAISQSDSRYRYRYTGLRILTKSPGKYLLLPAGWRKGQDSVFFILDDASIRVDVHGPILLEAGGK